MITAIALILAAVVYRIVLNTAGAADAGWIANFAPLAAIAFCGALYLPKRLAFVIPVAALLISDLVINAVHGVPVFSGFMIARYVALGVVGILGLLVRRKPQVAMIGAGSVVGTLAFYLITNTASWMADPGYVKSAVGWFQAVTVGIPGFPPTYLFLRNSLVSDLLFTALFAGCMAFAAHRSKAAAEPSLSLNPSRG